MQWKSITQEKNKYKNKQSLIIGCGPTADKIIDREKKENEIYIGINRSIILTDQFDYIFIDHAKTLADIKNHINNTRFVCMPVYSRGELNINYQICNQYKDKILLYSWVYECPQFYNAPEYDLNDFILQIMWGNVQSAMQFSKLLGCSEIAFYGVDGGPVNGQIYSKIISEAYNIRGTKKQSGEHNKTKSNIDNIAKLLKLKYSYASI